MRSNVAAWLLLLIFVPSEAISSSNKTNDLLDMFLLFDDSDGDISPESNSCSYRLHASLEKLRKRRSPITTSGFIDLSGYALHQTLRRAPLDMYVTDIKVRTPGVGNWVRVERCRFHSRENRLAARLLFNDLAVTGQVKLFEESSFLKDPGRAVPRELCRMTVRLRSAGLGITAFPTRGRSKGIDVRTEARFVDPNYLSVHAYGCKLSGVFGRDDDPETRGSRHEAPGPVRIITLEPSIPSSDSVQLHGEEDAEENDYHKERVLAAKFQSERDRLKAVLRVKNLIAQQANQVFQTHGPFSHFQSVAGRPLAVEEGHTPTNLKPVSVVSTITELDENLAPLRPVPARPHDSPFATVNDKIVNYNDVADELSREMEDTFLRGVKTLLTKYMEKQLEIPLKEALMVSIGYTVSYG